MDIEKIEVINVSDIPQGRKKSSQYSFYLEKALTLPLGQALKITELTRKQAGGIRGIIASRNLALKISQRSNGDVFTVFLFKRED